MKKTIILYVIFACVFVSFSSCGHKRLLQTDAKNTLENNTLDITEPTEAVNLNDEQMRPHQISVEEKIPKPKAKSLLSWENWKGTVYRGISYFVGTWGCIIFVYVYGERIVNWIGKFAASTQPPVVE